MADWSTRAQSTRSLSEEHADLHDGADGLHRYHKRSNAETTISMIKAKFGDSRRSKSEVGQANEFLTRVLAHNICCVISASHELGIDPSF